MTDEQKQEKKCPAPVVGALVLNDTGKFLLVRCPKFKKLVVPGGHVEWGETLLDALRREVEEEIGINIEQPEVINVCEYVLTPDYLPDRHVVVVDYLVRTEAKEEDIKMDEDEIKQYFWLTADEILTRTDVDESVKRALTVYLEKKNAADYKAGWQRALADYQNLQKEMSARRQEWACLSEQQILEEFLPVYEHLKMSLTHYHSREGGTADAWVEGVKHVLRQFADILKSHGVEEIKTVGEKFDPAVHEAAGEEVAEGAEPGTVIKEIVPGYKMGERVIRAAKVIVVK